MIIPTTVFPGADGAIGCDYWVDKNQLVFVEFDGDIDVIKLADGSHSIIGTGYASLEDIKISRDKRHAYVTEREGRLLRVDLLNPNRANAIVVSSGMTAPHQIVLDEDHHAAYVVEFAPSGRILRIDLTTGHQTVVATGIKNGVGLLLTSDLQFAYVSEQNGGAITRIRLSNGNRDPLVTGLTQPFFLTWLGAGESTILTTERDPVNKVVQINLNTSPATRTDLAIVPTRPSSVAVVGADKVYVCSDKVISLLTLSGFSAADPIFMGIGFVPISRIGGNTGAPASIPVGMATTDAGYFFQVVDSPFGGTLPLLFNDVAARGAGAAFYRVVVDGVEQPVLPYNDYRWNGGTSTFDLVANPTPVGTYYKVRAAGEIWLNAWLGDLFNTSALTNAVHTIAFRLFNAAHVEIGAITDAGRSAKVLIDNGLPIASIDQILHNGVPVPPCAIEHIGVDAWTFDITARDPEKHLMSWALSATWGANQHKGVASGSYAHVAGGLWEGLPPDPHTVPIPPPWQAAVLGDGSSTNCAHTFYLGVWDRVINGWGYIHYNDYSKSITILNP